MDPRLSTAFSRLEDLKSKATALISAAPDPSQPFAPGEWSYAQVLEHLLLAERPVATRFSGSLSPLPKRGLPSWFKRRGVSFVLRQGIKVPVPSDDFMPRGAVGCEELLEEWSDLRNELGSQLTKLSSDSVEGKVVVKHPVAGPLNTVETLTLLGDHLQYHLVRLRA